MTRHITCLLFEALATVVVVIPSSYQSWPSLLLRRDHGKKELG